MRTKKVLFLVIIGLCIVLSIQKAEAQDSPIMYTVVDYIKVKPENQTQVDNIINTWEKHYKQKIDEKKLALWVFQEVITSKGTADEYNYVSVYFYSGSKAFAESNDKSMILSNPVFEVVRKDVYTQTMVNGKLDKMPKIMWVQSIKLKPTKTFADFMKVERQLSKSIDDKLISNGDLLTSQVYNRVYPNGTSTNFDLVRLYGYNDLEQMLNFAPKYNKVFSEANPNFAGLDYKFGLSEIYKVEAWALKACSCQN